MSYRFLSNTPLCIFEREMQIIPGFDHSENYNCEYVDMLSAIICEMHYANLAQQIIQKIIALEVENLNFKDCGHQKRFNELKKTAKKQEWEFLKTGNGLAAAFLITANASLLNRAMPFITSDGFAFDKISLSGADEEMYDLYQAARFIAEGTQKLTLNDLAEHENRRGSQYGGIRPRLRAKRDSRRGRRDRGHDADRGRVVRPRCGDPPAAR